MVIKIKIVVSGDHSSPLEEGVVAKAIVTIVVIGYDVVNIKEAP